MFSCECDDCGGCSRICNCYEEQQAKRKAQELKERPAKLRVSMKNTKIMIKVAGPVWRKDGYHKNFYIKKIKEWADEYLRLITEYANMEE